MSKPRRPMRTSPKAKHVIDIAAEQKLIRTAQRGDKEAIASLVTNDLAFIRALAATIARWIIHKPDLETDVEDLVSVGVIEYLKKIPRYDKRKANGIRLRTYAYLDMRRAMTRQACDGLESVRLPCDNMIHKAHRDLDRGMSHDELAERYPDLSEDVRASLHRVTVSIDHMMMWEELSLDDKLDEPQIRTLLDRIKHRLDSLDREVIDMRICEVPTAQRAKRLDIPVAMLQQVERRVFDRVSDLVASIENELFIAPDEVALRSPIWWQLSIFDRRVIFAMRYLRDRPLYERGKWLRVNPAEVRQHERRVAIRVRELLA